MTRMSIFMIAAIAAAFLSACAKSPSSIAPMAVASAEYEHLSCKQMRKEQGSIKQKLMLAVRHQNNAQVADAATVFLVLIPASALVGDAEADVARYKGELIAVERAMDRKDCEYTPVEIKAAPLETDEPLH